MGFGVKSRGISLTLPFNSGNVALQNACGFRELEKCLLHTRGHFRCWGPVKIRSLWASPISELLWREDRYRKPNPTKIHPTSYHFNLSSNSNLFSFFDIFTVMLNHFYFSNTWIIYQMSSKRSSTCMTWG